MIRSLLVEVATKRFLAGLTSDGAATGQQVPMITSPFGAWQLRVRNEPSDSPVLRLSLSEVYLVNSVVVNEAAIT
jgi:hypothetical protein